MLIKHGEARDATADRTLAWSLAGIAGAVNAAGFYAAGLYSSHMTGTLSTLADQVALGDVKSVGIGLSVVLSFVLGAAVSTLLINAGQRRQLHGIYAFSVLAEALLLAGLGCADLWLPEVHRGPLLVEGLSFLMGLQNAIVTRISNARVRTTHVTGMVTDIGIEIGNLLDVALRRRDVGRVGPNLDKLKLHVPTVLSFFGGGVLGVFGYKTAGSFLLFALAGVLALIALPALFGAHRARPFDQDAADRTALLPERSVESALTGVADPRGRD